METVGEDNIAGSAKVVSRQALDPGVLELRQSSAALQVAGEAELGAVGRHAGHVHAVVERPGHAPGRTVGEEGGDAGGHPRGVHRRTRLEDMPGPSI